MRNNWIFKAAMNDLSNMYLIIRSIIYHANALSGNMFENISLYERSKIKQSSFQINVIRMGGMFLKMKHGENRQEMKTSILTVEN